MEEEIQKIVTKYEEAEKMARSLNYESLADTYENLIDDLKQLKKTIQIMDFWILDGMSATLKSHQY